VAGMNLEETEDMARFILDIREELGIAMILVEHDMGLVMDIADRVMVLDFGKKIAEGPAAQIQRDSRVVAAYLGTELAPEKKRTVKKKAATKKMAPVKRRVTVKRKAPAKKATKARSAPKRSQ
jgi:ABC-type glutathione transport system ATPase component